MTTLSITDILTRLVVTFVTPMFLATTGGDLDQARAAAYATCRAWLNLGDCASYANSLSAPTLLASRPGQSGRGTARSASSRCRKDHPPTSLAASDVFRFVAAALTPAPVQSQSPS